MVVIDSSVVFKWFSSEKEEDLKQALKILQDHIYNQNPIVVPELIIYELANAWATKTRLSLPRIKIFLKDLKNVNLIIEKMSFEVITKSVAFSKKYHVSLYDAVYAVLAKEKRCILITADERFVQKMKLPHIKLLGSY